MMWDWAFAWEILPKLARGFVVTMQATFGGFAIAAVLGLIWALMRRSRVRAVSAVAGGIVEFVRSTPLLVQLFFLYYALPDFGLRMSALTTGVLGLGLHYSAYLAEIYRAGIDGVSKGQWEAAFSLNFSRAQTWMLVILPQAIPPIIPALGNRLIALFKETPLLAAITVMEVLLTAREVGDTHFSYLEPYTAVGVFFLIASIVSNVFVRALEKRYGSVAASA
ncbi:MAG: ectoine/hydroxyectoine ABC transporter permease subunit EhuD [Deltaproteobacteria bacterium]|nr:ectoine/hydroxyectoine ABC transporter permease subunit EhuD [Deltaproteobacteria bacterium]